jgi:hypothetical protein
LRTDRKIVEPSLRTPPLKPERLSSRLAVDVAKKINSEPVSSVDTDKQQTAAVSRPNDHFSGRFQVNTKARAQVRASSGTASPNFKGRFISSKKGTTTPQGGFGKSGFDGNSVTTFRGSRAESTGHRSSKQLTNDIVALQTQMSERQRGELSEADNLKRQAAQLDLENRQLLQTLSMADQFVEAAAKANHNSANGQQQFGVTAPPSSSSSLSPQISLNPQITSSRGGVGSLAWQQMYQQVWKNPLNPESGGGGVSTTAEMTVGTTAETAMVLRVLREQDLTRKREQTVHVLAAKEGDMRGGNDGRGSSSAPLGFVELDQLSRHDTVRMEKGFEPVVQTRRTTDATAGSGHDLTRHGAVSRPAVIEPLIRHGAVNRPAVVVRTANASPVKQYARSTSGAKYLGPAGLLAGPLSAAKTHSFSHSVA